VFVARVRVRSEFSMILLSVHPEHSPSIRFFPPGPYAMDRAELL
jgi:hypothetical protein